MSAFLQAQIIPGLLTLEFCFLIGAGTALLWRREDDATPKGFWFVPT